MPLDGSGPVSHSVMSIIDIERRQPGDWSLGGGEGGVASLSGPWGAIAEPDRSTLPLHSASSGLQGCPSAPSLLGRGAQKTEIDTIKLPLATTG